MVEYTFRILLCWWWNILSVNCCIDGGIYFPYIVELMVEYTFRILYIVEMMVEYTFRILLYWWWNILFVHCCIDGGIYIPYIVVLMAEFTFRTLFYQWRNIHFEWCLNFGGIYCPYIVVLKVGCTFRCSESLMKVKCWHCALLTVYCCIGGRWEVEITFVALFSVVWADSDHMEGFRLINAVILSVVPICHDHKTS